MGFDTVVASIISIALIISVAYLFASGSFALVDMASTEYKKAVDKAVEIMNTKLSVLSVSYDNTTNTVVADIKNSGMTRFSDFSRFDVFVYGKPDGSSETYYADIKSVVFDIVAELSNPGIFDPHEIVRINVELAQALPNGTYVLVVCAPNGVCCSGEFTVGG
ncbi:hypothetical protein [Archaeoglobus profundus]|uniref:Flagellin n=1 Tax=Archaeoglobus profundus (strain DSM 5631 / JCM 9629 / NBRC 100127 / Av18) TaxID=572546 RepID=D2RE92_ARCPA|nr:hypothetical protein [Archaeoglobus profundus]ADB58436.1 flagellin [Archaeoglobus profundus DSM 5631]